MKVLQIETAPAFEDDELADLWPLPSEVESSGA